MNWGGQSQSLKNTSFAKQDPDPHWEKQSSIRIRKKWMQIRSSELSGTIISSSSTGFQLSLHLDQRKNNLLTFFIAINYVESFNEVSTV